MYISEELQKLYINAKVFTKFKEEGELKGIKLSGEKYQLYVKLNNRLDITKLGFEEAITNKIIKFENEILQEIAENALYKSKPIIDDTPNELVGNNIDKPNIVIVPLYTAEIDMIETLKEQYIEQIYMNTEPFETDKLQFNKFYGTNSQVIYLDCCRNLGWDERLANHFGRKTQCYARKAYKDYTAWFLPYSNYTREKFPKYTNYVHVPFIWEEYENEDDIIDKKDKRITFIKKENVLTGIYEYVFIGVYQCIKELRSENGNKVLKYKRLSKNYPE